MDATPLFPRVLPVGDSAFCVEFGDCIAPDLHDRVLAFEEAVRVRRLAGVVEVVPAYCSVTVYIDPYFLDDQGIGDRLSRLAAESHPAPSCAGRLIEIPVCYGGEFGPDLDDVSADSRLEPESVVSLHASVEYRVYMVGFSPGFPYLGSLPEEIAVPRLATPRTKVPPGSVGLAGKQTGIYPQATPGGWRIIGRTPLRLYNPDRPRPFLLSAGDRVRFAPITPEEFERLLTSTHADH